MWPAGCMCAMRYVADSTRLIIAPLLRESQRSCCSDHRTARTAVHILAVIVRPLVCTDQRSNWFHRFQGLRRAWRAWYLTSRRRTLTKIQVNPVSGRSKVKAREHGRRGHGRRKVKIKIFLRISRVSKPLSLIPFASSD